ncbi:methyltransferase [Pseudomonas saliphila]|uniref:methyltransferase n=1 Tax=Pseudomonas saliphila TaxID=2586906 RepID=UPI00123A4D43|nr:methyltransferase [Pseudomonas saliphila]
MDYLQRFQQLDAWLNQHQALWRVRPFTHLHLPWEHQWPELAAFLRGRSLEQAEQSHNQPHLVNAPAPFADLAKQSLALSQVEDWSREPLNQRPELLTRHVPGRKWQQITRFADIAEQRLPQPAQHWLDWCAGKGHLGRLLSFSGGQPLTCLEYDPALNEQGRALSQQCSVAASHVDMDVLRDEAWQTLQSHHTPVALHACGDLHMTLLRQSVARGCEQLVLSPCCYNRIESERYQPLSAAGRSAQLILSKDDLALPLLESVTAGQRVRRLRDQSMAWRLAFDLWQREARGVDSYLPTPARPQSALNVGIADFCRFLTAHHQLQLPEPASWSALEKRGWQRLAQVRNLELVGALFRRPLEIWLLLDRALFLQESGYCVQLGQFCPTSLTPRNLMLVGHK